jgi:cellulose synthase/poly-beta-1,6-N-acetylglucosamine synthase-like glycosyltransferase
MSANLLPILLSCSGFVLVVIGFMRLLRTSHRKNNLTQPITVVLPFRNEEQHQTLMLERLSITKIYPHDNWMLIDDNSQSHWKPELPHFAELHSLNDQVGSKKRALQFAIQRSENPIICTTDADCNNAANWIVSMRQACTASTNMVIGPVLMKSSSSLVSHFSSMESLALFTVTMGSAGLKIPLMCSGANLLFRKSAWQEVNGYLDHIDHPSGDDVLLMHAIWLKDPESIKAQIHPDSLVYTEAPQTWREFLHQRKRWASKSGHIMHYKKLLFSFLMILWTASPWFLWLFSWKAFSLLMVSELVWLVWITRFFKIALNFPMWYLFRFLYPLLFLVLPFIPPGKWKPASPTL